MRRIKSGFTIIELLVALGVTSLLVTLMLNITINVLRVWNTTSGKLTSGNQARLILDYLETDLKSAVFRRSNDVWFVATVKRNQPSGGDTGSSTENWAGNAKPNTTGGGLNTWNPNPSTRAISDYRFGHGGVWLRFFSIPSDNSPDVNRDGILNTVEKNAGVPASNVSAVRAISYQMLRRYISGTSGDRAYYLFRSEVKPGVDALSTFTQGYNLFKAGPDDYNCSNTPARADDAGVIRRPDFNHIIGNDVVDFGVRIFSRNTTGALVESFPIDRRISSNSTTEVTAFISTDLLTPSNPLIPQVPVEAVLPGATVYGYPEGVEILVRILTPEGAKQIAALESGNITASNFDEKWWEIVQQNSQVFTRRIEIRSSAL
jgi:prepilin-type N-terminal cleavage/methylation domain-containing protein